MKKKIVLASGNKHKLREIREILCDYEIVSCHDLGFYDEVEETGTTFYENAFIKAKAVYDRFKLPTLADDSGICVFALDDAPGIYSARYSPEGTDESNRRFLLENMKDKADRRARFVCCLVLIKEDGEIVTTTGETHGELLYEESGENGFGYDPIFYSLDLKNSLGIADAESKNSISHRGRALRALKEKLD